MVPGTICFSGLRDFRYQMSVPIGLLIAPAL
jgi:hypothetical protein